VSRVSTSASVSALSPIIFRASVAELWLKSLANRKRDPVQQTTIDNRKYALDKWLYPSLGEMYLVDVNNLALKTLVDKMASSLSAASIRDYSNIVKAVVASALDEKGEEKVPRKWNEEFIDAPLVKEQRQPSTTCAGMSDILLYARGRYRVLYALLAGCGPLRAGEALGLEIGKHISGDFRTLYIRQKAKRGKIQARLKTDAGKRDVDLCTSIAAMLTDFVGTRTSGLLFCTSTGKQILQTDALRDSLHPILDYMAHERGGFNIFRRFRITHLKTSGCPDFLQNFWSGHAQGHVSERYLKLLQKREFRLEWAERISLGFELPGTNLGQLGQLIPFRKVG
jgi:hypothetical protein